MDAARGNHAPSVEFLLHEFGASLGVEDSLGRQAIHHAAQFGALKSLEFLVANGADVNKKASINSITPLHYAAKVDVDHRFKISVFKCVCVCVFSPVLC